MFWLLLKLIVIADIRFRGRVSLAFINLMHRLSNLIFDEPKVNFIPFLEYNLCGSNFLMKRGCRGSFYRGAPSFGYNIIAIWIFSPDLFKSEGARKIHLRSHCTEQDRSMIRVGHREM